MGRWGGGIPVEQLARKDIREFLDWVYDEAVTGEEDNPGRSANKAREQIRAILYWAWEQELIDTLLRFPAPRDQRDVADRHYLTKAEINALYFFGLRATAVIGLAIGVGHLRDLP
jgi:hypothetical protein